MDANFLTGLAGLAALVALIAIRMPIAYAMILVGGGGIGYYLSLRINNFENHAAGTAIWAIVIVVWAMDFLSAEVRKRLT